MKNIQRCRRIADVRKSRRIFSISYYALRYSNLRPGVYVNVFLNAVPLTFKK
jgi:hypothetical protein